MFFVVTKAFLHEKKDWRFQSAKAIFNVKDSSEIKGKKKKASWLWGDDGTVLVNRSAICGC